MNLLKNLVIVVLLASLVSCADKKKKRQKQRRYKKRLSTDKLLVETQNGWAIGMQLNSMYTWRGIPYAKPPVDDLRFEAPEPVTNWTGVWNATYDRSDCYQPESYVSPVGTGSEDCLYINVYTPKLPSSGQQIPVMVFIYGGAFLVGSSKYSSHAPDLLVERGVIVVTFSYRLGILGFGSTGDAEMPGNNGLRDQIFALKWVQNNIAAFGGNPDQVTIFGESAGSASVSYLILSPLTKDLFSNAIMQSGTVLDPWSLSRKAKEATYLMGSQIYGFNFTNSTVLKNNLKKLSAEVLIAKALVVQLLLLAPNPLNGLVFTPVKEYDHKDAVFSGYSYKMLKNGNFKNVSCIIGYNSEEALFISDVFKLLWSYILTYDLFNTRLVPFDMYANSLKLNSIGRKIKEFYVGFFGSLTFPDTGFIKYCSDDEFVRGILKTVELQAMHATIYLYKFSYTNNTNALGAAHADDLNYIFKSNLTTSEEQQVSKQMVALWTNFAKTGNPTPENSNTLPGNVTWLAVNANDSNVNYLDINVVCTAGINPNKKSQDFWNSLYSEYGHPIDTY